MLMQALDKELRDAANDRASNEDSDLDEALSTCSHGFKKSPEVYGTRQLDMCGTVLASDGFTGLEAVAVATSTDSIL